MRTVEERRNNRRNERLCGKRLKQKTYNFPKTEYPLRTRTMRKACLYSHVPDIIDIYTAQKRKSQSVEVSRKGKGHVEKSHPPGNSHPGIIMRVPGDSEATETLPSPNTWEEESVANCLEPRSFLVSNVEARHGVNEEVALVASRPRANGLILAEP
jgi:hypothetical protein